MILRWAARGLFSRWKWWDPPHPMGRAASIAPFLSRFLLQAVRYFALSHSPRSKVFLMARQCFSAQPPHKCSSEKTLLSFQHHQGHLLQPPYLKSQTDNESAANAAHIIHPHIAFLILTSFCPLWFFPGCYLTGSKMEKMTLTAHLSRFNKFPFSFKFFALIVTPPIFGMLHENLLVVQPKVIYFDQAGQSHGYEHVHDFPFVFKQLPTQLIRCISVPTLRLSISPIRFQMTIQLTPKLMTHSLSTFPLS